MSRKVYSAGFGALATSLALSGCVVPSRPVSLPNGAQGLAIDCSGGFFDIADCMNHAAEHCGGPYHIISKEEHSTPTTITTDKGVTVSSTRERIMIVECGKEPSES